MKHKTKNRLIKKKKGRKTKKMRMRRGGGLFSSMSFGIPGFGSAGTCPDEQTWNPQYGWLKQKCYMFNGKKILKTQNPNSSAANGSANGSASGATTPTKSWYQFW